jgi:hypothetical protein
MPDDVRYEEVVTDDNEMTRRAVREHHREFNPGRVVGGVVGLLLAVVGVVAIARAGIDSSLDRPVVDVFGMQQSAIVGLAEFGVGLLVILGAASEATRSLMGVMGVLALVGGVLGAAASASVQADLGMRSGSGWFLAVCGAIVLASSLVGTYAYGHREVRVLSGAPTSPRWH